MIDTKDPLGALRDFGRVAVDERTRFYSRDIDERLAARLEHFEMNRFPWGETDEPPGNNHQQGWRGGTNATGLMAFAWANPMSLYHGNAGILAHIRARLLEFARTQIDGAITWRGAIPSTEPFKQDRFRHNLNLAWSIEPLAMAANWIRTELDETDRATIDRMLRRAADLLVALPCNERNNRGAVRCAVLALLGHQLGDRSLIDAAVRDFHEEPSRIFNRDGQINEGPGPDANYSGTSFIYCYTYRIFSGDITIDVGLRDGARWYTWASDSFGAPTYFGAATRIAITGPSKVGDFIPAMERYVGEHPSFHPLIDRCYMRSLAHNCPGHVVHPLIFAFFEHESAGKEAGSEIGANWFTPSNLPKYNREAGPEFRINDEGTDSLYYVLRGRKNHATVSMMGRFPYKGIQHWNLGLEPPVFWPTVTHASKTRAFGLDTARMRIEGGKFTDISWREGDGKRPNLLITRTGEAMCHYLQTATTLLYLVSCPLEPREDIFIIDTARCGEPILADGLLRYEGREGRMCFTAPQPARRDRKNGIALTFTAMGRTALYAFSDSSFELLDFSPEGESLRFRDATGAYRFAYEIRFFGEEDMAPIGEKGLGALFLSQMVMAEIEKERDG